MTVSTTAPLVLLTPLADRNGAPAALLFGCADASGEAALPLSEELLRELAAGLPCFFRDTLAEHWAAALREAGWEVLPAQRLQRADHTLIKEQLAPATAWIEGDWFLAPPPKPVGNQAASRALALQLVQLVTADADTHEIEALLRKDPTLSYHLLRLVNSLGMGTGRRVSSFSQAILILGRSQLRRWLNLMLFSSRESDLRSPMLLARVAVRARALEVLARNAGLDKHHQEQAFMVGMFSLLGVLFGMPLAEVLAPLTVSEDVQRALLERDGELGALLGLLETAERGDFVALAHQLQGLQIEAGDFNQAMAEANLWMIGVVASKAGPAHA